MLINQKSEMIKMLRGQLELEMAKKTLRDESLRNSIRTNINQFFKKN